MGQAFRRAAGKLRSTTIETPSSAPSSRIQNSIDRTPPAVPNNTMAHIQQENADNITMDGKPISHAEGSEERDSNYEAMLNQMVGRISTKPGGKLEMGEAFVVRKSNRSMPKLRNTTSDIGRYEETPVTAGTLNVAQLRHIMRMHQEKADEHNGPVNAKAIAEMYRLDPAQVEKIFQFVSLPSEHNISKKQQALDD